MRTFACGLTVSIVLTDLAVPSLAEVVAYTDEAAYLNALALQGYVVVQESFEDDTAWGVARSPETAPSVTNLGITWASSSSNNDITTGTGPGRTGQWGFYSLPHGDYANGITDGWRGTAAQPLVAIGGWVETNTPPAGLALFLDGDAQNPVDFGGGSGLGGPWKFFGVIDPNGFTVFDFRETEGTIGDQKFIFGDDFSFAFGGVIQDCNQNGVADAYDIASGSSTDCNNNVIPDECEIDINSQAPGGPFFCTEDCAMDCNDNGVPDECEVVTPDLYTSGQLSPIGHEAPQSFTIVAAPVTRANAILSFTAYANLGGTPDHISVDINGVPVGTVFGPNGNDCPELQPDSDQLIVSMATFNDAVNGGDAIINMVASFEVDPQGCDLPTYVTVEVQLSVPSEVDLNENGVPDECEGCLGDLNLDDAVNMEDFTLFSGCTAGPGVTDAPLGCDPLTFGLADLEGSDGDVDLADLAEFQRLFGASCSSEVSIAIHREGR